MKKNKMMRTASGLLVAVLLTTCIISGTFAKYVTTNDASDTARVAKWGVEITAANDLFSTHYAVGTGNKPASHVEGEDYTSVTVVSSDETTKLVAPGTESTENGLTFSIKGKPEVATKVTFTFSTDDNKEVFLKAGKYADRTTGNNAIDTFELGADYYPVVFTLKSGSTELATGKLSEIEKYLFDTFTKDKTFNANTDLSKVCGSGLDGTYTLTWKWAFGSTTNDKQDTLLGDLANNAGGVWKLKCTETGADHVHAADSCFEALEAGKDFCTDAKFKMVITVAQVD